MIDSKVADRAGMIRIFYAYLRLTYVCKRLYAFVIFYILDNKLRRYMIIKLSTMKRFHLVMLSISWVMS